MEVGLRAVPGVVEDASVMHKRKVRLVRGTTLRKFLSATWGMFVTLEIDFAKCDHVFTGKG